MDLIILVFNILKKSFRLFSLAAFIISFLMSSALAKTKTVKLTPISGSDSDIQLRIDEKSLKPDLSRGEVRLNFFFKPKTLISKTDSSRLVSFEAYEILDGNRVYISETNVTVGNPLRTHSASVPLNFFIRPNREVLVDLKNSHGILVATYKVDLEASKIEAQITTNSELLTDSICDNSVFGKCQMEYILENLSFESFPVKRPSTEIVQKNNGEYKVRIGVPVAKNAKIQNTNVVNNIENFNQSNPVEGGEVTQSSSTIVLSPRPISGSPVNGALEFDGSKLYYSSNGVRKEIAHTGQIPGDSSANSIPKRKCTNGAFLAYNSTLDTWECNSGGPFSEAELPNTDPVIELVYDFSETNGEVSMFLFSRRNLVIDWGDSKVEAYPDENSEIKHSYENPGIYTVKVYGVVKEFGGFDKPSLGIGNLIEVKSWRVDDGITRFIGAFREASNLTKVPNYLPNGVSSLNRMFLEAANFNQDISGWDTSSVVDMSFLFYKAYKFNQALNSWDVSNVYDMERLFSDAWLFNQDLNSWDTSKVRFMHYMFAGAESFNGNITTWNTSNVVDMQFMFLRAYKFNQDISTWDVSRVEDMEYMFHDAWKFNQPIGAWGNKTSNVKNFRYMFVRAYDFNQDLNSWDTSKVIDMSYMFHSAQGFNGSIAAWDTSKVTNMESMFYDADNFNQDISAWQTDNVRNLTRMFYSAQNFNQDIGNWNTSQVESLVGTFAGAWAFNQNLNSWDTSNVTNMETTFKNALAFNGNVSTWNTSSVKDMNSMFYNAQSFNQDLSNWDTSSVEDMSSMFRSASKFNQNLNLWNTSNVKDMTHAFNLASVFNGDITTWNTSNVTSFYGMFNSATNFNQDISGWNTSNVKDMTSMFYNAQIFNQDISSWDTSKVKSMRGMFSGAKSFNQNLNTWNTSSVTDMASMFTNAHAFDNGGQELTFDTSNVINMESMFNYALAFTNNNLPLNLNTSKVINMKTMFYNADSFFAALPFDTSKVMLMNSMFFGSNYAGDLSSWCVEKISSEPNDFDSGAGITQPSWGVACP